MAEEIKTILSTMLLAIYAGLILLLIPWLPVAIWCVVFVFGDPMPENFGALFWSGKVIPSFVLVYPISLVHGVISSWQAMKDGKPALLVLLKALYPLLLIIQVLLIVIAFSKQ